MQSDGRLVKNIEDAAQVGAKLGGKADALRLAAAQRVGRTIQCQVAQSYLTKKAQALNDLGKDVGGNFLFVSSKPKPLNALERSIGSESRDAGNCFSMEEDAPSGFVDACSTADRAGTCLAILKNLVAAFLRELSLERRIEVLLRIILPHLAEAAAMRAPAVRRVKGEKPRIQRLEGAAALRTIHFRAYDVELPFAVPNASRALANFKRPADELPRISARQDFADQCVDRVFLKPLESRKAGDGRDRAVHKKKIDTIARSPFGNSCMEALCVL